jgi:cytochrome c oxidase cbb3-type subunit 1
MLLVVLSAGWLVVAGLLGVLAAIKLHAPGMLADHAWLTYGRVQPAAWNALVLGFASPAGLAMALWMTARLGGTRLLGAVSIIAGTLVWNLGLKLGIGGILAGDATGFEGLELPRYASPLLLIGYLLIAPWALLAYTRRADRDSFPSQWYLVAGLLAFPWAYVVGHLGTSFLPLRGVMQAAVQAWYLQNLYLLWFGCLGLAAILYLVPKLTGAVVPSRNLALFGFWTWVVFGGLGGLTRYSGGPFPAWMTSLAVVAGVLLLFPTFAVAVNVLGMLRGRGVELRSELSLRFAGLALLTFVGLGVLGAVNSLASVRHYTHHTLVGIGLDQVGLAGFFSAAVLGVYYFMVPRLLGAGWAFPGLGKLHFALVTAGTLLLGAAFLVGGVAHGLALNDPGLSFLAVVKRYLPWASTGTMAQLLLFGGALVFAVNLLMTLVGVARRALAPVAREWTAPVRAEVKA